MTLVSLPSPILWPGILGNIVGGPGLGTAATIDAAGEYLAYVFVAREDMTISHIGFRVGTAGSTPTVIVSIEGLDATGFPDGAATYGGSASSATSVSTNTNPVIALGGAATVAKGQAFCVKIAWASGSIIIQEHTSTSGPLNSSLPYKVTNTGTPTKGIPSAATLAIGSSSTAFYQVTGSLPASAYTAGAFNNTNSAKRGLKFTLPFDCRIIGIRWYNANASGNYNAVIYDNGGTPAELSSSSTAFDGDINAASSNAPLTVYFDNPVTGDAGSTYRAVIEPSSSTNANVSVYTIPTDHFGATPAGSTAVYTSFATATWTDSTTQLPLMDVIIDQLDDGAGGGGGGTTVVGVVG